MEAWAIWFVVAMVVAGLEMVTGTLYLLALAAGLAWGGAAALMGLDIGVQFIVAGIVAVAITLFVRHRRAKHGAPPPPQINAAIHQDIGQSVQINDWVKQADGYWSRAMYRGALWDVRYAGEEAPAVGLYYIAQIDGNVLRVAKSNY